MDLIGLLVLGVVALAIYSYWKPRSIVRKHAPKLAERTGKDARQVYREIVGSRQTPGEWAAQHGLHPHSFQPVVSDRDAAHERSPDPVATEIWGRIRLTPHTPMPSIPVLREVIDLQQQFAAVAVDATPMLPSEMQQLGGILVELHARGARIDAEWVRGFLEGQGARRDQFSPPRTQEELDAWQQRAVEQAASEED